MPKKTQLSQMPAGKMQFGIIVPIKLHQDVKHLATDEEVRISDIYARGAQMALDAHRASPEAAEQSELARKITKDIDKPQWRLFEALGDFLRGSPRGDQMDMLKLILGKYLPEEGAQGRRLAKVNG